MHDDDDVTIPEPGDERSAPARAARSALDTTLVFAAGLALLAVAGMAAVSAMDRAAMRRTVEANRQLMSDLLDYMNAGGLDEHQGDEPAPANMNGAGPSQHQPAAAASEAGGERDPAPPHS